MRLMIWMVWMGRKGEKGCGILLPAINPDALRLQPAEYDGLPFAYEGR